VLQNLDPKSMARPHRKFLSGFDTCSCWRTLKRIFAAWKRVLSHSQSAPPRDASCDMNFTSTIRAKPCCKPLVLKIGQQGTVRRVSTSSWSPKRADLLLACAHALRSTAPASRTGNRSLDGWIWLVHALWCGQVFSCLRGAIGQPPLPQLGCWWPPQVCVAQPIYFTL